MTSPFFNFNFAPFNDYVEGEAWFGHWWSSDFYGPHGLELQQIEFEHDGNIRCTKVTGDANVPKGYTTWRSSAPLRLNKAVGGFVQIRPDVEDSDGFIEMPCLITALSLDQILVSWTGLHGGDGMFLGNFYRGGEGVFLGNWYSADFYGHHGKEHQRIEMQGCCLQAMKITGDPNVPCGCWTWRALGRVSMGRWVEARVQVRQNPLDQNGFEEIPARLLTVDAHTLHLNCAGYTGTFIRDRFPFMRQMPDPELVVAEKFRRREVTKDEAGRKTSIQAWNFAAVPVEGFPRLPNSFKAPANSITGRFELNVVEKDNSLSLAGRVPVAGSSISGSMCC
eukprot:gnl/MRDRNA2_/MRDRNA2_31566_c0_seq1.p1 gnl/MRDRNA2_/MRDRNA2_31566_c0~~gnl/MRDRNA2_/MRDRNA2_31566_c0_seq1.p1  ORF type:complete len:336 (+),score=55.53 gnl/MRDRNA2_/MRDRNA2_31566_c0_seq1:68-1075(+)